MHPDDRSGPAAGERNPAATRARRGREAAASPAARPRFRVHGDPAPREAGAAAAREALLRALAARGEVVAEGAAHDALVVSGATLHESGAAWAEAMRALEHAQEKGRRTWLLDSHWENNGPEWDHVLQRLDGVWLRGVRSAAALRRHGVVAPWHPDLCFQAPLPEVAPVLDFGGGPAVTALWNPLLGHWSRPMAGFLAELPFIDTAAMGWPGLVASLRTAGYLVAGRAQDALAACRARVPFIAVAGECHEMEDLLEAAPRAIPVCRTRSEIEATIAWMPAHRDRWEALFDWLEARPPWRFPRGGLMPVPKATPARLITQAEAALARGAGREAMDLADRAERAGEPPEALHPLRLAGGLRAGAVPETALLVAATRLADASRYPLSSAYDRLAAPGAAWAAGPAAPAWWRAAVEADRLSLLRDPATADAIGAALAAAPDAEAKEAARGLLLARFTGRFQWDLADRVEEAAAALPRPEALRRADAVLQTAIRRRFTPAAVEEVRAFLAEGPDDPSLRHRLREHLWMAEGATRPLLLGALEDAASPADAGTGLAAGQAVAVALALDGMGAARDLARRHPQARLQGARKLPVAAVLAGDFPAEAALHAAALSHTTRLREALADPGLRVAVVGNGLPPARKRPGATIDAHGLVVRFNDFRLARRELVLGRRTDLVGTSLLKWEGFRQPHLDEAMHGALLPQHRIWVGFDWRWVLRARAEGVPIGFFPDDELRRDLQRRLGVFPSSGLLLLALLRRLRGRLDPDGVFCMPLLDGAGDARRSLGDLSHNGHAWEREAALFRSLVEE